MQTGMKGAPEAEIIL